ncbi:uncharacterized protein PG986_002291 [Apiospora aurea]|uniref:Uncharacterized protein n=1 Tax=Apiospora aurea TaxID=335848 RepID=A0ABR1QZG2_9PEZI
MSPVFPASLSVTPIASREALNTLTTTATNSTPPDTLPPWQVICAWPVSGQYGPGSRYLYYALVAACILARKSEWLRNACLAAGLLFPAIAAFHGIVLAAMHIDAEQGAVDMDVYGAFQLCTIGILAAPVTVRWSKTYFYDPARNLIFLWTGLILAGLLSLTVEFYRLELVDCRDQAGNAISPSLNQPFPYEAIACSNIPCSVDDGPSSSLRQGSTNEIFLVPAPQRLTFGAATLLAAACCIPAILSMVSMWNKILEINWKRRFGPGNGKSLFGAQPPRPDEEVIEGTNGATVGKMKNVNDIIRSFLSVVQIPVFVGAVLSIMVVGELNFWSESVNYQTEPVSSIGQWAPIVGTVLAALGSLYVLGMNPPPPPQPPPAPAGDPSVSEGGSVHHCDHCSLRHGGLNNEPRTSSRLDEAHVDSPPRNSRDSHRGRALVHDSPAPHAADPSPEMVDLGRTTSPTPHSATQTTNLQRITSNHDAGAASASEESGVGIGRSVSASAPAPSDAGGRRKVAQMIGDLGRYMGTPAPDLFDDSEFKRGPAQDWPEIPGEATRNPDLGQIRSQYNQPRDSDTEDNVVSPPPPLGEGRVRGPRASPAAWWRLGAMMQWAVPSSAAPEAPGVAARANTLPVVRTPKDDSPPQSPTTRDVQPPRRRDTLEVPSPTRLHATSWSVPPTDTAANTVTSTEAAVANRDPSPPTIVISPDPESVSLQPSAIITTAAPDSASECAQPERDPSG